MRLVIVSPYPPAVSGIGQYGFHVSCLLARSALFSRVTVLTSHDDLARVDLPHPIEVARGWRPDRWLAARGIVEKLQRIQPDLVWFNLGASAFGRAPPTNLSGYSSVLQAHRAGFPTVVTLHEVPELADLRSLRVPGGIFAHIGARLLTSLATNADVTCLTTRRHEDWLAVRHPKGRFVCIPLGAYGMPQLLPEPEAPELLLFTTLAPFKGVEVLLEAFQMLRPSHPDLWLTIAGVEHIRFPGYLGRLQRAFGSVAGVRWLGQVAETEVRGLFERAQLVILPYTTSTGASSVLWQAATWGRAIVASDLSEIRGAASENEMEITFFHRGDAHSLMDAIETLLVSPEHRRAQALRNLASLQNYRPQDTCRAYLSAFDLALEVRRSPKRIALPSFPGEPA